MEAGDYGLELRPRSAVARRADARELRALSCGRCSGGGGSSSSSSTSTQNIDKRQVVEQGVAVSSDTSNVTVNALDGGAVAAAFDFATRAGAGASEFGKAVITEYLKPSLDVLRSQQQFVKESGEAVAKAYDDAKGEGTQKFLLAVGVGAMVAVVAVNAFKGK